LKFQVRGLDETQILRKEGAKDVANSNPQTLNHKKKGTPFDK